MLRLNRTLRLISRKPGSSRISATGFENISRPGRTPGGAPKPAKEPEKLVDHRKQTAAKVRVARTDAKQGDIFTPEITEYFRQQITATFAGPEGPKIRASLRRAEPVRRIPLKVNAAYPAALPRQSTPPTLLLNLPRLPKELEYRIVGRDLALHDTVTNLIVDFIPNAIPAS